MRTLLNYPIKLEVAGSILEWESMFLFLGLYCQNQVPRFNENKIGCAF